MTRIPSDKGRTYIKVEAILEAPKWALVLAIILMTIIVIAQVATRL